MDVRCGVRTAQQLPGVQAVQGTVLYEEGARGATWLRTVNGFVLVPRDRGLEYASLKYRR